MSACKAMLGTIAPTSDGFESQSMAPELMEMVASEPVEETE